MFLYNNNNHQKHKTIAHSHRKASSNRTTKVKASSSKRKLHKQGKSLNKANAKFLKALGFKVGKRQR